MSGNGNWFVNGVDTGQKVQGEKGDVGAVGPQGLIGPKGDQRSVNIANTLSTASEGYALDARQGKALNEKIGETNRNLAGKSNKVIRELVTLAFHNAGSRSYGYKLRVRGRKISVPFFISTLQAGRRAIGCPIQSIRICFAPESYSSLSVSSELVVIYYNKHFLIPVNFIKTILFK